MFSYAFSYYSLGHLTWRTRATPPWLAGYFRVRFFDCDLAFTADQTNSCSFSRTTSTGQGAARTTRSAVLPMQKCFHPVYPCVAITIRSTSKSLAASTISCDANPVRSADRVSLRPVSYTHLRAHETP